MTTYTAQVGPDNAARLSELTGTGDTAPIEDIGEGSVQVNDLDWLKTLGEDADGHVTEDEDGPQIWIGGEGYPLFDDVGQAVAEALGAQTEYDQEKLNLDRYERAWAGAVSRLVTLTGSAAEAAARTGIDEATISRLLTLPR